MLQARARSRRQLPCVHSCTNWAGSQCRKVGGHQCSKDTSAIDGGALNYGARTEAARIDSIDPRMARAIGRVVEHSTNKYQISTSTTIGYAATPLDNLLTCAARETPCNGALPGISPDTQRGPVGELD